MNRARTSLKSQLSGELKSCEVFVNDFNFDQPKKLQKLK